MRNNRRKDFPVFSVVGIGSIILLCIVSKWFVLHDPHYMDLRNCNVPPCKEFLLGTDSMGRDVFSMLWSGGLTSLFIGVFSTIISSVIAIFIGAISASVPKWIDIVIMRFVEILMCVPSILILLFLQSLLGANSVLNISISIGIVSWFSISKIVRTEILQIRNSEYVLSAKCMGGGFFYVLMKHYLPSFFSAIVYMIIMNIRSAIIMESTLSFLGMGLPLGDISLGSMLSLSENSIMIGNWWSVIAPGLFMIIMLVCVTNIGNYLRKVFNSRTGIV